MASMGLHDNDNRGLFLIVGLVIFSKVQNGAAEYVSLMSGLAGIALG